MKLTPITDEENPYTERIIAVYQRVKPILRSDVTLEGFREAAQKKGSEIYVLFPEHWLFEAERIFNEPTQTQLKFYEAQIPAIVAEAVIRDRKSIGMLLGNKALKRGELPIAPNHLSR